VVVGSALADRRSSVGPGIGRCKQRAVGQDKGAMAAGVGKG
jgi:hypothetical protein